MLEVCSCRSKLTKNDKKVLKFIIENGRSADSAVAKKLGITPQGVVKIRNKLEKLDLINGYNPKINYKELGLNVLSIAIIKFLPAAYEYYSEKDIVEKLNKNPHIIWATRLPTSDATHMCMYGFENFKQMEDYLYTAKSKLSKIVRIKQVYSFSSDNIIKQSEKDLLYNLIDDKSFSIEKHYEDNPSVKKKRIVL